MAVPVKTCAPPSTLFSVYFASPVTVAEVATLVSELTVGETYFFREPDQFDLLRRQIVPEWRQRDPAQPIRVWSAGCASGEEAYSLAMLLDQEGLAGRTHLIASDINPQV